MQKVFVQKSGGMLWKDSIKTTVKLKADNTGWKK